MAGAQRETGGTRGHGERNTRREGGQKVPGVERKGKDYGIAGQEIQI